MPKRLWLITALLSLAGSGSPLHAQALEPSQPRPSQSPDPGQTPTLSSNTTVVLVPAMVTGKSGEPVFTLTAKDFTLTDDGVPQNLDLEEDSGGEPLALVVALQTGGAGARQIDKYRTLAPLIEAIVGEVPRHIAVISFGSTPKIQLDFTSDPVPFENVIKNISADDHGGAVLDGLGYAVDLLRDQPKQYRRAVILFSETLDQGSQLKLESALRIISDTNTAVYSLGFSSIRGDLKSGSGKAFEDSTPGPKGGCMARDSAPDDGAASADDSAIPSAGSTYNTTDTEKKPVQNKRSAKQTANQAFDCLGLLAPPLKLAKLAAIAGINGLRRNVPETVANLTGGEYFPFKDAKTMERDLTTISNHVPNRYILSFHPQSPHPGLHAVTLRLKDYPHLDIQARTSYWADSEPAARP